MRCGTPYKVDVFNAGRGGGGGHGVDQFIADSDFAKAEIADERPKYEKSAIFSDSVQKGQLDVQ
jgi:hypothetical protein